MRLLELLNQNLTQTLTTAINMVIVDFGGTGVAAGGLPAIAAALTKQAQQHFALPPPYAYGIGATIRAGSGPHDVHPDEWVIGLLEKPDQPGALGYHDDTPNGKPFMKIFPKLFDNPNGDELSVTISHEVLETLADPNGARAAQWKDGKFWAYEVCDAVVQDSYAIDGIKVSNFCLPPYFEPVQSPTGLKLDWMGLCKKPLEVRPGGYSQWFDPNKGWQQIQHADKPSKYRIRVSELGWGRSSHRKNALKA